MFHHARTWAGVALTLTVVLLSLSVVFAQDAQPAPVGLRPDAPPYAVHGPYWIGTREFVIEDSERPLPVTVWYPASSKTPESEHTYMFDALKLPAIGKAIPDAETNNANKPYPLVLFSHGAGGFRFSALYLTEHLASYGFVVMAMDHTGDTMANANDEEVFIRSHVTRPMDITKTLDFAETLTAEGGTLAGLIDIEHVAVIGHSSGAWTAVLAAGGRRDFRALTPWCADHADDVFACGTLLGKEQRLAQLLGLDSVPDGLWPAVGDARVDAIVPMAPGNAVVFGPEGLGAIKTPTLLFIGTQDMFLPYDSFGPPTYEAIAGQPKAFVTFEGGDHMMYSDACDAIPWMLPDGFMWCSDPVWDMNRAHDLVNHFTTAFLLDVLKGDKDAHTALLAENVSFPGITYETTMK